MNEFNEAFTVDLTGILIDLHELVTLHVGWVSSDDSESFTLLVFVDHSNNSLHSSIINRLISYLRIYLKCNLFFLLSLWHLQVHQSSEINIALILNFLENWLSSFFNWFWYFVFVIFFDNSLWVWYESNFVSDLFWFDLVVVAWNSLGSDVDHDIEELVHGFTAVLQVFGFVGHEEFFEFQELVVIEFT